MDPQRMDQNTNLMLDGNAAAGVLQEIFAREMTGSPVCCAGCGRKGEFGSLHAYTQAPGIILRCPACEGIILRVVQTPQMFYVDFRGAKFVCIPKLQ